ncbi:MAG: threonine synthase, partial [Muribaculaceae bacterium]|nr:threonine synthase [Muribaculaceae bacterium]
MKTRLFITFVITVFAAIGSDNRRNVYCEMKYYSTSKPDIKVSMHEAVTSCIPQTGGLYMPEALPMVPGAFIHNTSDMTLQEIAYAMTDVFMGSDISSATIKKVVDDALSFDTPIVRLSDGLYVLELFHGPTNVFKDIGSRFLAGFFNSLNPHDGTKLNVLVTTAGNTGMAVAKAFAGKADMNVFILFPHGSVSRDDIAKMKSAGTNIHTLEIGGTIDDCRAIVSSAFSDKSLRENVLLTTANSTNFARLMPQVALFFYGVGHLANEGVKPAEVDIAVPSGNLGMLTSGLMAKRIGLQCNKLIAACNANNAFDRFVKTGELIPMSTVTTYARLMDMSSPSNLPRLLALSDGSLENLRSD